MKIADRVQETTQTTGTGTLSLAGADTGYQAFSAAFSSGDLVPYVITDGTNWECGVGTLASGTPWTLARTSITASSNGGAAISVTAGSRVFCDAISGYIPRIAGKQVVACSHTNTTPITISGRIIECSTDGDGDTDVIYLPDGTDGQELELYVKSNGSLADNFRVYATFADGSTYYEFGTSSKGRGITLVYTTTAAAGWIICAVHAQSRDAVRNYSTASQAPSATTRTYITGSALRAPATGFRIGTILRWTIHLAKTAAGSASSTFDICFGVNGTTSDTARVSFTKPAGSAASDAGVVYITAIVRGPISGSCIVAGLFHLTHNLSATGHATIPDVVVQSNSAAFDITASGITAGVCITSGSSDSITIQMVTAEALGV